jgi:hypothetical protein
VPDGNSVSIKRKCDSERRTTDPLPAVMIGQAERMRSMLIRPIESITAAILTAGKEFGTRLF